MAFHDFEETLRMIMMEILIIMSDTDNFGKSLGAIKEHNNDYET